VPKILSGQHKSAPRGILKAEFKLAFTRRNEREEIGAEGKILNSYL